MSDLTIRSREAAQRDIAVAALEKINMGSKEAGTNRDATQEFARVTLARIAEIGKGAK